MPTSVLFNLIGLAANFMTLGAVIVVARQQSRLNTMQRDINKAQNEVNAVFHARLMNLERQLPTADAEEVWTHVH